MKTLINNILRKVTGYQISKFDIAPYEFRERLKEFIVKSEPRGKILDIGSARWNFVKEHFRKESVTTLDLEAPADVIASVMDMPFEDNSFDTVVCTETLEHVEDPFKALAEIHRVLKPGGKFIGSTPFAYELHGEEYGDYWRFTRQGWKKMLFNFTDISITPHCGKELFPGWYMVTAKKNNLNVYHSITKNILCAE